jgi:hypothetical protein
MHLWHALHWAWEQGEWLGVIGAAIGLAIAVSQADITAPASYCGFGALNCPQQVDPWLVVKAAIESSVAAFIGGGFGILANVAWKSRGGQSHE